MNANGNFNNKEKILIIDDNKPFAWALKRALIGSFECDILLNIAPERVITHLKRKPFYSALVLNLESKKDHTGEAGIKVLEEIRLHEDNEVWSIPVVMLSSKDPLSLIKENPQQNLFILSDGCELLKYPSNIAKLFNALDKISPLKNKGVLNKYMSLAWGKELTDEKHGIANEFGALKLAEGAKLAKEISPSDKYTEILGRKYLRISGRLLRNMNWLCKVRKQGGHP